MSEILSYSAPPSPTPALEVMPSPTLELAYAYYVLGRPDSPRRAKELPWLHLTLTQHAQLVADIRGFWDDYAQQEGEKELFDLFLLACRGPYPYSASPNRLIDNLAVIIEQTIADILEQKAKTDPTDTKHHKLYGTMLGRLHALQEPTRLERFTNILRYLWSILEPFWQSQGLAESQKASEAFLHKYRETGNVLDALPPHHFTQFETSASEIKNSQQKGKLFITPLFFASGGGFNYDMAERHFIGYGLQSELVYAHLSAQVNQAAQRMKALADPTRLMLLTLIARYQYFGMTVGDFAVQLGVSQPTVSGHLKQLREANLVLLEKQGNKALYKVNGPALEEAIGRLQDIVLGAH